MCEVKPAITRSTNESIAQEAGPITRWSPRNSVASVTMIKSVLSENVQDDTLDFKGVRLASKAR